MPYSVFDRRNKTSIVSGVKLSVAVMTAIRAPFYGSHIIKRRPFYLGYELLVKNTVTNTWKKTGYKSRYINSEFALRDIGFQLICNPPDFLPLISVV